MAIIKRIEVGQRNILPDGQIQVRLDTIIEEDDVELTRTYHRHVVLPGSNLANEHPLVQRVAQAEHTVEVINAFRARQ